MEKPFLIKSSIFLIFLILILIFLNLVFGQVNLSEISLNILFYALGKFFGLVGFLTLSFLIILGDTARFFDKYFGLDKIISFNKKLALATTLFVLSHPVFFMLSRKRILTYIIPNFSFLPLAIGIVAFYIYLIVVISSALYKRISYNIWQYIHILTYLLFFFSLYHAFKLGSDSDSLVFKIIFWILTLGIIIGVIYRLNYKLKQRSNKFYVKEIKPETKDTFSVILDSNKKFKFKAGQWCFLRLNKKQLYARHPFTISSSPKDKNLRFTINEQGIFTKALKNLKQGEEVILEGPFGVFTLEETNKDIVFIAGGVGITPLMSMIKDNVEKKKEQKIGLLYGSKTKEDIIFKKELDNLSSKWFKKVNILSPRKFPIKFLIEKYVGNVKNKIFYICGPEPMKNSVKKELLLLGVKNSDIKVEDFFW